MKAAIPGLFSAVRFVAYIRKQVKPGGMGEHPWGEQQRSCIDPVGRYRRNRPLLVFRPRPESKCIPAMRSVWGDERVLL